MNAYGLTMSAGLLSALTLAIVTIDVGAQTTVTAPATFHRDVTAGRMAAASRHVAAFGVTLVL